MVPALTQWIDKAKERQIASNARTVYLAAQTLASEHYGDPTKAEATAETVENFLKESNDWPGGKIDGEIKVSAKGKVISLTYIEGSKKAVLSEDSTTGTTKWEYDDYTPST